MKTTILGVEFTITDLDANYEVVGTSDNYSFTHKLGKGRELVDIEDGDNRAGFEKTYGTNIDLLGNYGSFDVRIFAVSDIGIRSEFIQSNIHIDAPDFNGTFMFSNIQVVEKGKTLDGEILKTPTELDNELIASSDFNGRSISLKWSIIPPPGHAKEGEPMSDGLLADGFFDKFEIVIKNGIDQIDISRTILNSSESMQQKLSSADVYGALKEYRSFSIDIDTGSFNDFDLDRNVSFHITCCDKKGGKSVGIINVENKKPVLSNFLKSNKGLQTAFSWDCKDADFTNVIVNYVALAGGNDLEYNYDIIESVKYLRKIQDAPSYVSVNNKLYQVGEIVKDLGVVYKCKQQHNVSSSTLSPDADGNDFWEVIGVEYPHSHQTNISNGNAFDLVQLFGYNYYYSFQPMDEYGAGDVYNLTANGIQVKSEEAVLEGFGYDLYIGSVEFAERKDDLIFKWDIVDHQFNRIDLNRFKDASEQHGVPLVLGVSGSLFDVDNGNTIYRINESKNKNVTFNFPNNGNVTIGDFADYEIYNKYEYTRAINNGIYGTGGFPESSPFSPEQIYSPDTNHNYATIAATLFKSKIQNSIGSSNTYIRPGYPEWDSSLTIFVATNENFAGIVSYAGKLYKVIRDFGPECQDVKEFFNENTSYLANDIVVAPAEIIEIFDASSSYQASDLVLFDGKAYVAKQSQSVGNAVSPGLDSDFWTERSIRSAITFALFKATRDVPSPISFSPFGDLDNWEMLLPDNATDYFELYADSYNGRFIINNKPFRADVTEWDADGNYSMSSFVVHKNDIWYGRNESGPAFSIGAIEPGTNDDYWKNELSEGAVQSDLFSDHSAGDLVYYNGYVHKCLADNPTGAPLVPITSFRTESENNYDDCQWKPFWELDDSYDSIVFGHVGIPESGKRNIGLEVGIVGINGNVISSQKIIGTNPPPDILRQGFTASSTTKASRVRFNFNYKEGFAEKTTKVNLYRSSTPEFDITGSNKFAASSSEEFLDPTIPNPDYNASFVKTTIGEGEHADFGDNITEIFDDPPLFVDSDGIEHPTGYYYKILPFDDFGSGNLYGVKDNMHDLEKVIVYPKSYHSPDPHAPIGEIPKATQPGVSAGDATTVIVGESIPGPIANFTGVTAFENYFLNWDLPNSEILKEQNGNKLVAVQPNDIDHFEVWESSDNHLEVNATELTKDQNLRGYRRILGDLPSFGDVPAEELDIGYDITNATEIMEIAGGGFSFEAIHQGATNERRYFWIRAVDAAGNKSPFTGAADLTTDTVEGLELTLGQAKTTDIADFEQNISQSFPNTISLIPQNPFSYNSNDLTTPPGITDDVVDWDDHVVYHDGEGYLVKAGSLNIGAAPYNGTAYIYWSSTETTAPGGKEETQDLESNPQVLFSQDVLDRLETLGIKSGGEGELDKSVLGLRNVKHAGQYKVSHYHPAGLGDGADPDQQNQTPKLLKDDGDFIIARIAGGAVSPMWHSFANAVIGSAHIEDAAITNAKIHNLTADKIRSAVIQGQDIQIGDNPPGQIRSQGFEGLDDTGQGFVVSGDGSFVFAADDGRLFFDNSELVLEGKLRQIDGKEYTFVDLDASPDSFFYNELSDGTFTPDDNTDVCTIRASFQNSFIQANQVRFRVSNPNNGYEFIKYSDFDDNPASATYGKYDISGFKYDPTDGDFVDGEPKVATAEFKVDGGFNQMINTVDPQLTTIIVSVSGVNTSTERSIPINFVADGAAAVYAELKAQQQVYSYDYDGKFNDTNLNLNLEAIAHNTHGNIEFLFETGVNLEASSLEEVRRVTKDTNTTNTDSLELANFADNALQYYNNTPFVAKLTISDEDGELASDFVSIFGTLPGKDSYTVFLTNENHTYPAQENGSVTSSQDYVLGQTKIKFFRGNTEYTHDKDGSNANVRTYRIDSNLDVSPATVSASIVDDNVDDPIIRITDLPKNVDEGTITINIYDNQYYGTAEQEVFSKVYTFSKTKEGAKGRQLELTAPDQTIEYNSQGSRIGPDSVTITANTENFFHATPKFEFYSGDFNNTIQSQGVGNTYTHDDIPASYDSDHIPVTILCKAFDSLDGTTFEEKARDQITIFGIKEGANAITFVQSQEFANVPVANSSSGDVDNPDFSSTTNEIKVFEGIKELTYDGTSDGTTKSNFYVTDVSVKDASNDAVITSVTKTGPTSVSPSTTINGWTDLTITNVYLEYSIKVVNHEGLAETFSIRQNVTLTFDGTIARKVDLLADKQAVKYNTAGKIPNPTSITLTAEAHNTLGTVAYVWEVDGSHSLGGTGSTRTFSPPNDIFDDPIKIKVKISENGTSGPFLAEDEVTIYGIQDGSDVITAILSNEAHSLTKDSQGTTANPSGITSAGSGTDIKVFQGTKELTFVTGNGTPSNEETFTVEGSTITSNGGVTNGGIAKSAGTNEVHCVVSDHDFGSFTGQSATITYTITFKNDVGETGTITKQQTFSISAQGIQGNRGVGITFRGVYDENEEEYIGAVDGGNRGDVVEYNGSYYLCIQDNGTNSSQQNPTNGAYWEGFGAEFSSVATDILLAKDAGITHSLVMGTATSLNNGAHNPKVGASTSNGSGGIIRSANKTGFGDNQVGFFLGDTDAVRFEIGDSDSFIKFNSVTNRIEIQGALTFNDITDGSINPNDPTNSKNASFIGGGYNNSINGFAGGVQNDNGVGSAIVAGGDNEIVGRFSFIGAGFDNVLKDNFSAIVAGFGNEMPLLSAENEGSNFIGAGQFNKINGGTDQSVTAGSFNQIEYNPDPIDIPGYNDNPQEVVLSTGRGILSRIFFGDGRYDVVYNAGLGWYTSTGPVWGNAVYRTANLPTVGAELVRGDDPLAEINYETSVWFYALNFLDTGSRWLYIRFQDYYTSYAKTSTFWFFTGNSDYGWLWINPNELIGDDGTYVYSHVKQNWIFIFNSSHANADLFYDYSNATTFSTDVLFSSATGGGTGAPNLP